MIFGLREDSLKAVRTQADSFLIISKTGGHFLIKCKYLRVFQVSIFVSIYVDRGFDFIVRLLQRPAQCSSTLMFQNFLETSRKEEPDHDWISVLLASFLLQCLSRCLVISLSRLF